MISIYQLKKNTVKTKFQEDTQLFLEQDCLKKYKSGFTIVIQCLKALIHKAGQKKEGINT